MNEFDNKATGWDKNAMHRERAAVVAREIIKEIPLSRGMRALEFGAGTGLLSFMLKDRLKEITMVENSPGMLRALDEKMMTTGVENMKILNINLEHEDINDSRFDLIYTLMVLHHIEDVGKIISRFHDLLNPGGYLALADLYTEDGSFHGDGFSGHKGFDPQVLSGMVMKNGFEGVSHRKVYEISREAADGSVRQFPVFLIIARRMN
jgi:ubiquinone/menaquinone biosynthesis C-methylase UbiE